MPTSYTTTQKRIATDIRAHYDIDRRYTDEHRENCFVCGEWKTITEYHHLMPVAHAIKEIIKSGKLHMRPNLPFVWLCPNHHAIIHSCYMLPPQIYHQNPYNLNQNDFEMISTLVKMMWKAHSDFAKQLNKGTDE